MTTPVRDTYLGWDELRHFAACRKPTWTIDTRTTADRFRAQHGAGDHSCPNEECGHSNRFEQTTVRIVCQSCGRAYVLKAEEGLDTTSTKYLGYGLQPRRLAGLWLWPGKPFLSFGRLATDEPWDFLVTRTQVKRVRSADVIGEISQSRGKRGAVLYCAVAVPSEAGPYGIGARWAKAEQGLRTVAAAAKWVAAQTPTPGGGA